MKLMMFLVLMLMGCGASQSAPGNQSADPEIQAYVKEIMPGNMMADDVPAPMQTPRRFERIIFVQLPSIISLAVDSIGYDGQVFTPASTKKLDPTSLPYEIGTPLNVSSRSQIKSADGKSWWIITCDGIDYLEHLPPVDKPVLVYAKTNGSPVTWKIDREIRLAPQERY